PTLEYDALTPPGDSSGKARAVAETQKMCMVGDSLVLCRFVERVYGYTLTWNRESGQAGRKAEMYVEPLRLATGLDFTLDQLETVGERIWNLIRWYNLACGMTSADLDVLPRRLLEERIPSGPSEGKGLTRADLRRMLGEYYAYVGWDDSGRPKPETLSRLGLRGNLA
ncbi:MAG: aldehyde ferredoxin oxidoreductase C-terminal domain-containing protein, partial [Bacillota bacterium]